MQKQENEKATIRVSYELIPCTPVPCESEHIYSADIQRFRGEHSLQILLKDETIIECNAAGYCMIYRSGYNDITTVDLATGAMEYKPGEDLCPYGGEFCVSFEKLDRCDDCPVYRRCQNASWLMEFSEAARKEGK